MERTTRIVAGLLLITWMGIAAAQGGATSDRDAALASRLAAHFTRLAGSEENALALVNALRSGDMVRLVAATQGMEVPDTIAFETPPGGMELEDVRAVLLRAQDSLARAGIRNPSGSELQAALLGGDVVDAGGAVHTLTGVLQ